MHIAEGGRIGFDDGGPSQKDIDKGIAAIEKLKSSLMPESYEELIEIYKDKQKDLNIDIMESAGGLGEMLGEGGRAGFDTGGSSIRKYEIPPKVWPLVVEMYEKAGGRGETGMSLKEFAFQYFNKAKGGRVGMQGGGWPGMLVWLAQQGPKVWKWMNKPGNNPYDLYKKYLKSVKERSIKGDMKSLAPELGAITAGGIMANRWASKKLKEGLDLSEEEKKRKWWERGPGAYYPDKAQGGRVGMMYGGDPGFAFSYGGSWADWKDNHASEMPLMDYINQKLPKARHPFSDAKYQDGGHEVTLSWEEVFKKYMNGETLTEDETVTLGQVPLDKKAEGGRIGLANGTTMDAFDSMTPNRKYMMTGESDVHRIMPPMGGILPLAGAGIFALSQKDKDKKTPQKKEGPNLPEPKPPFKIGDLIIDFIVANSRLPKPSEEGQLKEIIRVAKEKAEGITSLFNENLHGINTQRFIESAQDTSQKLLEDLVDVEEHNWDPKTGKETSIWKKYRRSDKDRPPTPEELEDDYGELWNEEQSPLDFGSTIAELDAALEDQRAYEEQMRREYYSGALDKYVKPEELEKQRLSRQKKIDKVLAKAYEEVFYQKPSSGDYKYDADVLADSIAEQLGKEPFDEMPVTYQRQIYDSALKRVQQDLGMKKRFKKN